jgi:hypothetical protein
VAVWESFEIILEGSEYSPIYNHGSKVENMDRFERKKRSQENVCGSRI